MSPQGGGPRGPEFLRGGSLEKKPRGKQFFFSPGAGRGEGWNWFHSKFFAWGPRGESNPRAGKGWGALCKKLFPATCLESPQRWGKKRGGGSPKVGKRGLSKFGGGAAKPRAGHGPGGSVCPTGEAIQTPKKGSLVAPLVGRGVGQGWGGEGGGEKNPLSKKNTGGGGTWVLSRNVGAGPQKAGGFRGATKKKKKHPSGPSTRVVWDFPFRGGGPPRGLKKNFQKKKAQLA